MLCSKVEVSRRNVDLFDARSISVLLAGERGLAILAGLDRGLRGTETNETDGHAVEGYREVHKRGLQPKIRKQRLVRPAQAAPKPISQ